MQISVEVTALDTDAIKRTILTAITQEVNKLFRVWIPNITTQLREYVSSSLRNSEEYIHIIGELRGELGVVAPQQVLDTVIRTIAQNIVIDYTPVRITGTNTIEGSLLIALLRSDFSDLYRISGASFISEPSGSTIEWLRWLLEEGEDVVIAGFGFNAKPGKGRTGLGYMLELKRRKNLSPWRVPPQISGTRNDNWITRALSGVGIFVEESLKREVV